MSYLWSLIITLAIIAGQLIKVSFSTNGSSAGVSLLDLVVFIFCIVGLIKLKLRFKRPPLFIIFAFIFIFISFLSLALTPLYLKPIEYIISAFYILRFSSYLLFILLIYSDAFTLLKKQVDLILICSGVGLATLGLLQFVFLPDLTFMSKWGWDPHYFRTISTFLDPNFAGAFFVLTLLLLIKRPKILFLIVYFALLTTFSRSSYLMFLTCGLSLAIFWKSKQLLVKTLLLFLLLLVGFYIYTISVSLPRNIDRQHSANLRLNTWQHGLILFQKFPILGVGFNSYRYALREHKLGDEEFLISHGASSNDSSLLFIAATTGIIGLISYLFFLSVAIKEAWAKNVILISAIFGLLIHSFFANSLFFPPILFWILLTSANPKK